MHIAAKIGLGLIIASGVGAGIYFGFVKKDADGKTWMDRMIKPKETEDKKEIVEDKKETTTTTTTTATNEKPTRNDSFPLSRGMRGPIVARLQTALINNFSIGIGGGADGDFGSKTAAAITSSGYSVPVSESDYNDILAGKKKGATTLPPSGTALTIGKGAIAIGDTRLWRFDKNKTGEARFTSTVYRNLGKNDYLGRVKVIDGGRIAGDDWWTLGRFVKSAS